MDVFGRDGARAGNAMPFTGDHRVDADRDSLSSLLERRFGTSDSSPDLQGKLFTIVENGGLNMSLQVNLAADDMD